MRLDSGFLSAEVMGYLEDAQPSYIVAARFYEPTQHAIAGITIGLKLDEGIEGSHIHYQSPLWKEPRQVVVVRQRIDTRSNATGKMPSPLKEDQGLNHYRYAAYMTSVTFATTKVWRLYRGRADAENSVMGLKANFGIDSSTLGNFFGTYAALSLAMNGSPDFGQVPEQFNSLLSFLMPNLG